MNKQELIDNIANDLATISAPLQAHKQINQTLGAYKQLVDSQDKKQEEDKKEESEEE